MSYTQMVMLRRAPLERGFSAPGGLLPVLLIAAVLLCHGALGFAHQVWCDPCEQKEGPGIHHGSTADTGGTESEQAGADHASGLAGLAYAAVITALLGAAFLGLLGMVRGRLEASISRTSGRRLFPTVLHHRPRGPTLPSLQVFRL